MPRPQTPPFPSYGRQCICSNFYLSKLSVKRVFVISHVLWKNGSLAARPVTAAAAHSFHSASVFDAHLPLLKSPL
eukprot:3885734-Amphidinium_carterae.1